MSPSLTAKNSKAKIWPSPIFYHYGQYVYQIKAENILNSYLTWKSIICYEKFDENQVFYDFASFSVIFFFSKLKFFRKFYIHPPIFFSSTCWQDDKLQIHQVWHTYLDHTQNDEQSNELSLDSTPPGFFRVKGPFSSLEFWLSTTVWIFSNINSTNV